MRDLTNKTKILLIGDIHGDLLGFKDVCRQAERDSLLTDLPFRLGEESLAVIQLGDWGMGWENAPLESLDFPVMVLEGNHEHYGLLQTGNWAKGIENVTHLRRGEILRFPYGVNVGIIGGADSIDKKWRTPGVDWFPEEKIGPYEVMAFEQDWLDTNLEAVFAHDIFADAYTKTLRACGNPNPPVAGCATPDVLQVLLEAGAPSWWFHGHHHNRHNFFHGYQASPEGYNARGLHGAKRVRVECLDTTSSYGDKTSAECVDACTLLLEVTPEGLSKVSWE